MQMFRWMHWETRKGTLTMRGVFTAPFGRAFFGGLSFGIDNNIQMKVRDRKAVADSGEVPTKRYPFSTGSTSRQLQFPG